MLNNDIDRMLNRETVEKKAECTLTTCESQGYE